MRIDHARDHLTNNMNWIKAHVFRHDPDDPLIFHRKDIMGYKGPFQCLRNTETSALFNKSILRLFEVTEYTVITALIDKQWMLKQYHWQKTHPYHYLMEILVEKYAQFLQRMESIGDIMPESRQAPDGRLQAAYDLVRENGTQYASRDLITSMIRGKSLKFRRKKDNISGLQLCDLLAHPSHMNTRVKMRHDVELGPFAVQVKNILESSKYDRSPFDPSKIIGYGIKHLPR